MMAVRRNVLLCIWVLYWLFLSVSSFQWVDPSVEEQDERNDAEIFRAIVTSMREWEQQRLRKRSSPRPKREDAASSVCYENLGCFESSGPYGYLDALPAKPEEINTKFWMYPGRRRRKSGSPPAEVPFERLEEAFEWAKQGFNASLPTKVLIHGFGSDCSYIWVYEIRSALMAVEEVNIICVDWSNGAALPNYVKASANTRLVGKQLSLLLRGLVDKNGLSLRKTHLIGFSLGAHIAGFAGADLGNLSRITGLDPAGPLFESQDSRARLDQTDASFVDVIHSNGENLILGGLGSSQPMGHVDFYPNGGRMQKGCSHLFVGAVSDIIWSSPVEGRSLCNHRRAYKFFIDSVSPRCHFPAFPCESYEAFLDGKCFPCTGERTCGNMGYYADVSKGRGQLYLVTRDEEPFCAHQYLVKIETLPSPISIKSYGKIQITLIGESNLNETFTMTKKDDEEMRLGESISRILVPHPILAQLTRIEILYTAYTGWLSSGLTQWKMDKVTLMDSFGKMSSVCKKNLILESGTPVTLPLYPGECNLPHHPYDDEDDADALTIEQTLLAAANKSAFVPTQVVRLGPGDKPGRSFRDTNRLNPPWRNEQENDVDGEETAESSRAFHAKATESGAAKEIVEPILKTHQVKNARSHDPSREKNEISEPILRPTTAKSTTTPRVENATARASNESREANEALDHIANTVQFLPHRLAKMFEEAEKYAKETILPLVSTYTPRFISDIITPKEQQQQQKVIPLDYEKPRSRASPREDLKASEARSTTPFTHIQKIKKKGDKEEAPDDLVVAASEYASSSASYSMPPPSTTKKPEHVRPRENPLDAIVNTIQVLPRTLGSMLEQAERFTRTTVLPFVSSLTPRFVADWFSPSGSREARFIPFSSGESFSGDVEQKPMARRRRGNKRRVTQGEGNATETTTYSHIQKIGRKSGGSGAKLDKGVVKEE